MSEIMDDDNIVMSSSVLPPPVFVRKEKQFTESSRARQLWWALPLLTIAWLAIVAILCASLVRVQYWEVAPGTASPVSDRLSFDSQALNQVTRYPAETPLLFVTAFGGQMSALDAVIGWIDSDVVVQTYKEHFGTSTPTEQRRLGFESMTSAKQIAEFVAFNRLGLDVSMKFGKVVVEQLVCLDLPTRLSACKQLNPGDTITALDGEAIVTLDDLIRIIANYVPGDVVTLSVIAHQTSEVVDKRVQLIADPDDPQRTLVGFIPADTRTVELPFEVDIDTNRIGGPSAGLAFTLALLDELTPGDLVGGTKVAATGTISDDESVGAIGALRQKTVAVKAAGAKVFLVPASQSEEEIASARQVAGSSLRIIPVANLTEALNALADLGGSGLTNATIQL
ncbi:MAG: S16 family serine protease [Ilumatobacteraceae bacterium]